VYFSKYPVLNNAALNGFWNVVEIISKPQVTVNPYNYFDDATATAVVDGLYKTAEDTTTQILTTARPNIILVMMESMSADNFDVLGGEKGIAPCFDSLCKQGILFTDFYASGFRTDQGLVAMISGFPAQPASAVIKNFGKFDKMPNLVRTLSDTGYYTSYYCGGNYKFANTDTYLISAGIDKLSGEHEVPYTRRTQWGAYDEDLYSYVIADAMKLRQPFFSIIATITNHEAFDADVEKVFKGGSMTDNYKNTAHYADKAVFDFIQKARSQPWFSNTIFIITADHAHRYPMNRAYNEPLRHHIPFLLYGDVIKPEYSGTQIKNTASQVDFPATMLAQLNISAGKRQQYQWSKNLFNKYSNGFAFYAFDNGFGFVTPAAEVVYDHNLGQVVMEAKRDSSANGSDILRQGKAYLQTMFGSFIKL
jgi:phosphoglycerol transferase MdoB-like AlkP superfamily enzyme